MFKKSRTGNLDRSGEADRPGICAQDRAARWGARWCWDWTCTTGLSWRLLSQRHMHISKSWLSVNALNTAQRTENIQVIQVLKTSIVIVLHERFIPMIKQIGSVSHTGKSLAVHQHVRIDLALLSWACRFTKYFPSTGECYIMSLQFTTASTRRNT